MHISTVMKCCLRCGLLFTLPSYETERGGIKRLTDIAKQTNVNFAHSFFSASAGLTYLFSVCASLSFTLHSELLEMRGSHSLCVVISIDLSTVQQPFPADFLSFTLPPTLTLYLLIVPPNLSHPSFPCSEVLT